uniref:Uncharacterized protein n=1 Tax=Daphnia galeata TaxID=27404 RepID=A0A8J2WIW6_9CRUS|nr:unnamed protein product [Daphnia galeata]
MKKASLSFIEPMDMHRERQFLYGRVVAGGREALVFVNYGSLAAFVDTQELYMDGTFHSPPRGFSQLATLHVIAHDLTRTNETLNGKHAHNVSQIDKQNMWKQITIIIHQ